MTTIDLRPVRPGWTVHFTCGGSAAISSILRNPNGNSFEIVFDGDTSNYTFLSGACARSQQLNIVRVNPPPMTEAQMREALAEIARIAKFVDVQCYTGTVQDKIREILALAEGKS